MSGAGDAGVLSARFLRAGMMEKNVGGVDRRLRFLVGGLLVLAGVGALATGASTPALRTGGVMALAGGGSLLANALTRRCLVNRLLGLDTCGENC